MNRFARPLIALVALVWFACPLRAGEIATVPAKEVGLSEAKLGEADAVVEKLIEEGKVAGAIVLIGRQGKIAHFKAYGVRNIETGDKMTTDTIARFYSMTKPITSVAVMTLWEQGKCKLDDPIAQYLPEFKGVKVCESADGEEIKTVECKRPPTIRDLLRHTSGLTYGIFGDTPVDQLYRKAGIHSPNDTLEVMIGKLGEIPLAHQPGTRWHYSISTDVLARIVEVLSGKSFDEYLNEAILNPLDMKDTSFVVRKRDLKRFASVHTYEDDKLVVREASLLSPFRKKKAFLSGGGGLLSTARDYSRFCQMMLNGGTLDEVQILKPETVKMMTKNQLPDGVTQSGQGFGLGFSVRLNGDHVGEYGWGGAASTHFWISPKDDLYVITVRQFMPYQGTLENRLKPIIYDAIEEK